MAQTQRVEIRPVPQYEPQLEEEPTGDPTAMWEQHLGALGGDIVAEEQ